jgi:SAM-dependent methyltransferase
MFAWAAEYNQGFGRYRDSEVGFWPEHRPDFGDRKFDAIFSANFIEHIDDPLAFVKWAASRLAARGRMYLEWPTPQSLHLPTTKELAAAGVNVMVGAYHDDTTHRPEPPKMEDVSATLLSHGLIITESGFVRVPFIDRQLAIHARRASDLVAMTLAYWSHTDWCQYLVAELG